MIPRARPMRPGPAQRRTVRAAERRRIHRSRRGSANAQTANTRMSKVARGVHEKLKSRWLEYQLDRGESQLGREQCEVGCWRSEERRVGEEGRSRWAPY